MQNRTMRAAVSTRVASALLDFCMTWRTFMDIDQYVGCCRSPNERSLRAAWSARRHTASQGIAGRLHTTRRQAVSLGLLR